MAAASFSTTLPNHPSSTQVTEIPGGWKFVFYYYPQNNFSVSISPCITPQISYTDNPSGSCTIRIDYDDGTPSLVSESKEKVLPLVTGNGRPPTSKKKVR